jgi:hypothetical protein
MRTLPFTGAIRDRHQVGLNNGIGVALAAPSRGVYKLWGVWRGYLPGSVGSSEPQYLHLVAATGRSPERQ